MPAPDRKKRYGATPRPKQQTTPTSSGGIKRPLLSGLATGFLLGAGLVGLLWLDHHSPHDPSCVLNSALSSSKLADSSSNDSATPTPHFDFYNMLPAGPSAVPTPEKTVASKSPDHPSHSNTETKKELQKSTLPEKERYDLQCGSYKTQDEADSLRANLIMHGTHALIRPSHLPDGSVRFRVITGPYEGIKATHMARTALSDAGFNCIALRRP